MLYKEKKFKGFVRFALAIEPILAVYESWHNGLNDFILADMINVEHIFVRLRGGI